MDRKNQESYDDIIEDPRYKQCNKEALMALLVAIGSMIWWFAWGYGLGAKSPEEYSYIMGFPAWFFMSCIGGSILTIIVCGVMATKFYVDMPLGEIDENYKVGDPFDEDGNNERYAEGEKTI